MGRRLIESGDDPKITRLSDRRIGIREDHYHEWLNSRVADSANEAVPAAPSVDPLVEEPGEDGPAPATSAIPEIAPV
jgi:hypothetical protein